MYALVNKTISLITSAYNLLPKEAEAEAAEREDGDAASCLFEHTGLNQMTLYVKKEERNPAGKM